MLSVTFLFVYEISRESLNGFAPNSHERRIWSLARTSLKATVNFGGLRVENHLCSSLILTVCQAKLTTRKLFRLHVSIYYNRTVSGLLRLENHYCT